MINFFRNLVFTVILVFSHQALAASESATYHSKIAADYSVLRSDKDQIVIKNGDGEWTIFGATQPFRDSTGQARITGTDNNTPTIVALDEPFSDDGILPGDSLQNLAVNESGIQISVTPGEIEPASFVIQSGRSQLDEVEIDISTLSSESGNTISPTAIDVRIVKAWYQSASQMRRIVNGEKKRLVPELLLHDDDLVRVDHKHHVNLVRTRPLISDAKKLLPFSVPAHSNKQIWLTLRTPEIISAGEFHGTISVKWSMDGNLEDHRIPITVNVLPFRLEPTRHRIGMFYLGRLTSDKRIRFGARGKNERQMLSEFTDMKDHGVNVIGLDHKFDMERKSESLQTLAKTVDILHDAQFPTDELVYLDWAVTGSDSPTKYQKKISSVTKTLADKGVHRIGIYNADERNYDYLITRKHTFEISHNNSAFNIVALTQPAIALKLGPLLDIAILQHKTPPGQLKMLTNNGTVPLAYGIPHAAEEKPATVRFTYGYGMILRGFHGVFSYAYQAGDCWNDWFNWENSNYRANCMAYPTIDEPIPTLQWEAFREATDDLRYLETYARMTGDDARTLLDEITTPSELDASRVRELIIHKIMSHLSNTEH